MAAGHERGEVLLVINPASASGRTRKRCADLEQRLRTLGVPFRTAMTEAQGHATLLVREFLDSGGCEVIMLGGDGTLNEVVAGCVDGERMVADDIVLAIVHQGTGGDMTRGLGIPRDPHAALAIASDGNLRRVDVGWARFAGIVDDMEVTRGFISCANVGMGSEVVARVTGRLKALGNSGAFAVATISTLLQNQPRSVRLRIGEEWHAIDIVDITVANNQYMGGGMHVAPTAQFDDGILDVIIIGSRGRLKLVSKFPKIYKGTHLDDNVARLERTTSVRIETEPDASQGVVLDGELVGRTPVEFGIIPGGLSFRVP